MKAPRRPLSDQVARDAARSGLDRSWLLEAGAGTGKTTTLLDRVEEILKTTVPLERIAVITFTEKAAGELKQKLRVRIEEALGRAGVDSSWGGILRKSLETLDRATISTIHSFAASLLRERPVEAGVDPRFSVADGLASSMLMEETWSRWIEQETSSGAVELERALRLGATLAQIRALAFDVVEQRDVEPDAGPAPADVARRLERAREEIAKAAERLAGLAGACRSERDAGAAQIRGLLPQAAALSGATGDRLIQQLDRMKIRSTAGSRENWSPPSALAEAKEIFREMERERAEACRLGRTEIAHAVASWIRGGFLHAYRSAKESRRLLDFADLLIICRNMLRRSRTAREAFQARYDALLVDEFQDTDPLQAEIVFLLASRDPSIADWRATQPRPGKLFVVGDPKQSIYRFRRADIQIYEEARERIGASGGETREGLTQNFRTVPSILAWVNALFETLMRPAPDAPGHPVYRPIVAARAEPAPRRAAAGGEPRVLVLRASDPESLLGALAAQRRAAEARHVVALIRRAVQEGWPVCSPRTQGTTPIRHRDVALLFRTSAAMETYEEVLRENSVPYRLAGGKRYYMRAEVRALQAVLMAVDRPHDDLAIVSALRCPFFGLSDEELLEHAAGGAGWLYTREAAARGTSLERPFELLRRLHALRHSRPLPATLEDLYESTGALSLFYLKPDGDQRAANLLKAIDLARAHEAAGLSTFGSFVRWLAGMADEEREEAEAPLVEETEAETAPGREESDALRLMTIHKAKGLEFPFVVLCDLGGRPRNETPSCVVERTEGAGRLELCFGGATRLFATRGHAQAAEREKERLDAESIRLLYVAATRARDWLVLPAFGEAGAGTLLGKVIQAGFLPGPDGAPAQAAGMVQLVDGASLDTAPKQAGPFRLLPAEALPSDPSLRIEKAGWRKALDLALKGPTLGRTLRTASSVESWPAAPRGGGAGGGAGRSRALAVGTAAHAVLERIDLSSGRDLGLLCEEEATGAGDPALATEIRQLVAKALGGAVVKEALAAKRLHREMPFAAAGESWLAEGRVDLAFESDDGLTLVDFKTDQVESEQEVDARMAAYLPQAQVYACALSQVPGVRVSRVVLFFVRPGIERVLSVDESFLGRGRALLEGGPPPA